MRLETVADADDDDHRGKHDQDRRHRKVLLSQEHRDQIFRDADDPEHASESDHHDHVHGRLNAFLDLVIAFFAEKIRGADANDRVHGDVGHALRDIDDLLRLRVVAVLLFPLPDDDAEQRLIQHGVDRRRDRRDEVDQCLLKMRQQIQALPLHLHEEARHLEPVADDRDRSRDRRDQHVQQQVARVIDEDKRQNNTCYFNDRPADHDRSDLLQTVEKPRDIADRRHQAECQHQIVRPVGRVGHREDQPGGESAGSGDHADELNLPEQLRVPRGVVAGLRDLSRAVDRGAHGCEQREIRDVRFHEALDTLHLRTQHTRQIRRCDERRDQGQDLVKRAVNEIFAYALLLHLLPQRRIFFKVSRCFSSSPSVWNSSGS